MLEPTKLQQRMFREWVYAAEWWERIDIDGCCHILVADGNVSEEHIQFCRWKSEKPVSADEEAFLDMIDMFSEHARHAIYELTCYGEGSWLGLQPLIPHETETGSAALSATAATPSDEVVRLREEIAEMRAAFIRIAESNSPIEEKAKQVRSLARAALEPQAKDF